MSVTPRLRGLTDDYPKAPNVREYPHWRWLLRPICALTEHRAAWIRPLQGNPYANESWVLGCSRCGKTRMRF